MANGMNQYPGIGLDVEAGWAGLEQVRSFAASQEAQQIRDRAMSTPEGEALYAGVRGAFAAVDVSLGADAEAAQAELLGIARAGGASDEFVGQLQQAMANPEMLQDTDFVGLLQEQMGTLDMDAAARAHDAGNLNVQQPIDPADVVGALLEHAAENWNAQQPIDPADVVGTLHAHDAGNWNAQQPIDPADVVGALQENTAGSCSFQDLLQQKKSAASGQSDGGICHVGPETPPENVVSANTIPDVPDASATPEQVAEYDRRAKEYAQTQSVDLDFNNLKQYSSLAKYLVDTKDAAPLNKNNATAEDYSVISNLAYVRKFSDDENFRIMAGRENLTVQQYCDALLAADAKVENEKARMSAKDRAFLIALRNNGRYADLHIDHVDATDTGVVNTCVMALSAGDGHAFVGIQGTNGTVTDWINDGEFTRSELTAEEKWINERVNAYLHEYDSFDATGHSQGGRDAITLAAFLDPENEGKLRHVWSLDGPGYSKAFLDKYGDRFQHIKHQIYQVFPYGSYVGHFMEMVGLEENCFFVDAKSEDGALFDPWTHDNARWIMQKEDGTPGFKYCEQHFLSQLIRDVSCYLVNNMPPEVLNEMLPIVLRLLSNPDDPTELNFSLENIKANLSNISFGDGADVAAVVLLAVADGLLDLADKYRPYLEIAKGVLTIASMFPWPGAPFCAKVVAFLNKAEAVLEAISKLCEIYLEWKAEKKRAERAAYIAANGRIEMDYEALRKASEYMEAASSALKLAGQHCDYLWNCFMKDEAVESEEADSDGVLQKIWRVVSAMVSPAVALQRALKALQRIASGAVAGVIDFGYLKRNPYCDKGIDAIARVVTAAKSIQTGCGYRSDNDVFKVDPGLLSSSGADGEAAAASMILAMENAQDSVHRLGSSWEADDYTQLRTSVDKAMDDVVKALEAVKSDYVAVQQIAQGYSVLQQTSVQEFQAAAN